MSQTEVTARTRAADEPVLEAICALDLDAALRLGGKTSMCGLGSLHVLLRTVRHRALSRARLLSYRVNTEITPCGSTTGFAAVVFEP